MMVWSTAQEFQRQDELAYHLRGLTERLNIRETLGHIVKTIRIHKDPRWELFHNRILLERAEDLLEDEGLGLARTSPNQGAEQ